MEEYCVHLYYGDGKGKTTAAAGLCLRCLGAGFQALFCQFLKDGASSEVQPLRKMGAQILTEGPAEFLWQMPPAKKQEYCRAQHALFEAACRHMASGAYEIVILDEALDALSQGILTETELCQAIGAAKCEVVLTGRAPTPALLALADYATEMHAIKHPYASRKAPARKGIEY